MAANQVVLVGSNATPIANSATGATMPSGAINGPGRPKPIKALRVPGRSARDVMTEGIHCCREDDDLAKAVHHMEKPQLRRLAVINKSKRMVGILSLGDISHSVSGDMLSECVKSVSAHH
jgi:CBS domain-containing protein